jgi:type IV pilus assembly protein PilV
MLLEALVGIVIFAVGILGLVALQAAMTKAQSGAKFRAEAAYLASEVRGTMWADIPNLANYDTSANCATLPRCQAWADKVSALLPGGVGTIDVTSGLVTITITWTPPNEETHTYVTSTAIRT